MGELLKKTVGVVSILQWTRESYTGQELNRNCRVLNEVCAYNVSMDLEQLGLLGNRFYGRNHGFQSHLMLNV